MESNPQPSANLAALQLNARRAWTRPNSDPNADPPTVEDLVECLTNLACNRLNRIRELERQIAVLLREIPPSEETSSAPAEEKMLKTPDAGASET